MHSSQCFDMNFKNFYEFCVLLTLEMLSLCVEASSLIVPFLPFPSFQYVQSFNELYPKDSMTPSLKIECRNHQ